MACPLSKLLIREPINPDALERTSAKLLNGRRQLGGLASRLGGLVVQVLTELLAWWRDLDDTLVAY
jgi:hypothetical protein